MGRMKGNDVKKKKRTATTDADLNQTSSYLLQANCSDFFGSERRWRQYLAKRFGIITKGADLYKARRRPRR